MSTSNDQRKLWPDERFIGKFECAVLSAIQVLLLLLVAIGVMLLFYVLFRTLVEKTARLESIPELQVHLQNAFSGVLLTLIGLELIETVRAYLHSHYVRLEVVIIIALIALGRHIVELNPGELGGTGMIGLAALVLALSIGYYIVRITATPPRRKPLPRRDHSDEEITS